MSFIIQNLAHRNNTVAVNDLETAINIAFQYSIQNRDDIFGVYNDHNPIKFLYSGAEYIKNPDIASLTLEQAQTRKYIFIPPDATLRDIFWMDLTIQEVFGYAIIASALTPVLFSLKTQYENRREMPYVLGLYGDVYLLVKTMEVYTNGYEGFKREKNNWEY